MSIECFGDLFTPTCDYCGAELPDEFDFWDAVTAKKDANWHSIKDEFGWNDCCDKCWPSRCWDEI